MESGIHTEAHSEPIPLIDDTYILSQKTDN